MTQPNMKFALAAIAFAGTLTGCAHATPEVPKVTASMIARHEISTVPVDPGTIVRSATYTPSGKVLVTFAKSAEQDERLVDLATMDDDGQNFRPFFSARIPDRPKDNGLRFMIFPDNRRVFLGDFIIECTASLEACQDAKLTPVNYPLQVADGDFIAHRWSEMIVAPDNRHVSWNALLSNFAVVVFTGELHRGKDAYDIVDVRIVSTLDPFAPDPAHPDGVLPKPFLGGEVKQFVDGGTAISMVGAVRRDLPDSVTQSLVTGTKEAITDTPGYTETTIFSPDEKLGITMTTRFSKATDLAVLGLVPRPYPDSLQMGLAMMAYTHSVTGVRRERPGSIGPALIDIEASKRQAGYQGIDLNTDQDWVYYSPMSWSPDGKKAMWVEGRRSGGSLRIQTVFLPDYHPAPPVPAQITPSRLPGAITDLSVVKAYAQAASNIDVKVYGRHSGYLTYRRTPTGLFEKTYVDYSDDGQSVYSGSERMEANPSGRSTYTADVQLTGPKPGVMKLKVTFGPLGGRQPAALIFAADEMGVPLSHGYAQYDGHRIDVDGLAP